MRTLSRRPLAGALACSLLLSVGAAAPAQDGSAPVEDEEAEEPEEPEVATADAERLEALLDGFARALKAKDALRLADALRAMDRLDNPELLDPAQRALRYRAGRDDKRGVAEEAEELGIRDKDRVEEMLQLRVARVQAAAARVLGFVADDKAERALERAMRDKELTGARPLAHAAVIDALGRRGCTGVHDAIVSEYRAYGHEDVLRACVRYFGQVRTRDEGILRQLCRDLAAPEPGDPNSALNPPASYWEERWRKWRHVRKDVTWTLRRVTGQTFRPAEGGMKGDTEKALAWLDEHGDELGLR